MGLGNYGSSDVMTKSYSLDGNGALVKAGAATLVAGVAICRAVPLHNLLDGLSARNVLISGIPCRDPSGNMSWLSPGMNIKIVDQRLLPDNPDAVGRTKHNIAYPVGYAGAMLFDYDDKSSSIPSLPPLTPQQYVDTLRDCFPGLMGAALLAAPSAGAGTIIREEDGAVLKVGGGVHAYAAAADASDIPRAGTAAFERLWLMDKGVIDIAKNGNILLRTVLDGMVFPGERLDYVQQAIIGGGLRVEGRAEAVKVPGGLIDTRKVFPDLTAEEQAVRLAKVAAAKRKARKASKAKREAFVEEKVERARAAGKEENEARRAANTATPGYKGCLDPAYEIVMADGSVVTVADIVANPGVYRGATTYDPVEGTGYGHPTGIIYFNDHGEVVIYSHAHGGQKFVLRRATKTAGSDPFADIGSADGVDPSSNPDTVVQLVEERRLSKFKARLVLVHADASVTAQECGAALSIASGLRYLGGKRAGTVVRTSTEYLDASQRKAQRASLGDRAADAMGVDARQLRAIACGKDELSLALGSRVVAVRRRELTATEFATLRPVPDQHPRVVWTVSKPNGQVADVMGWLAAGAVECGMLHNAAYLGRVTDKTVFTEGRLDARQVNVAIEVMSNSVDGGNLTRLGALSAAPIMLSDGRACIKDGEYLADGKAYYITGGALTDEVARHYATMTVATAKDILADYVDLFAWSDEVDRAAILCHHLAYQARLMFDCCPIHVFSSPKPGGGKTWLMLATSRITLNRAAYYASVGETGRQRDGEFEKRLNTGLAGRDGPGLCFDEATLRLPCVSDLNSISTSKEDTYCLRALGGSDEKASKRYYIGDLILSFSGINLDVTRDSVRRVVMIRLDRDVAKARGWDANVTEPKLEAILTQDDVRGRLLAAGLYLLERHKQAPLLPQRLPLVDDQSNYKMWSETVREVAYYVTGADALACQEKLKVLDPVAIKHSAICGATYVLTEGNPTAISDIAKLAWPDTNLFMNPFGDGVAPKDETFANYLVRSAKRDAVETLRHHLDIQHGKSAEIALGMFFRRHHEHWTHPDDTGVSYRALHREPTNWRHKAKVTINRRVG